jgi:hypothetical protein
LGLPLKPDPQKLWQTLKNFDYPSKTGSATTICLHFPILPLPFNDKYFCFMLLENSQFSYAATF